MRHCYKIDTRGMWDLQYLALGESMPGPGRIPSLKHVKTQMPLERSIEVSPPPRRATAWSNGSAERMPSLSPPSNGMPRKRVKSIDHLLSLVHDSLSVTVSSSFRCAITVGLALDKGDLNPCPPSSLPRIFNGPTTSSANESNTECVLAETDPRLNATSTESVTVARL